MPILEAFTASLVPGLTILMTKATEGEGNPNWVPDPDKPVGKQLEGKGQLRDLRNNRNLKGVDIEDLLQKNTKGIRADAKGRYYNQQNFKTDKKSI